MCGGAGADDWRVSATTTTKQDTCTKFHSFNRTMGYLLTTLECTILEELTRNGVENGLDRTDADGEDFWCNEDAAAAVNPRDDRMEEKGKRRNAKENNLTVLKSKRRVRREEERM